MKSKASMTLDEKAKAALKIAVKKALGRHIALGVPAYIWKDSKVTVYRPKSAK